MGSKKWFVLGAIFFTALSSRVFGIDDKFTRATLHGLSGFHVIVEGLPAEAEHAGVSKKQLQTDIELKLRLAGIKVLTREEALDTIGVPLLYVNINTTTGGQPYGVSFKVEVLQEASLVRDPTIKQSMTTWSIDSVRLAGSNQLNYYIRSHVKDLMDIF